MLTARHKYKQISGGVGETPASLMVVHRQGCSEKKLMAMINDKGPEESRDTDATYIILSHQSVHLPGPSQQRGIGGGGREEGRRRRREEERKKQGERELSTPGALHTGIAFLFFFFSWEKVKKQVTKR